MPEAHKRHAEWTSERILSWVEKSGSSMKEVAQAILESRVHPEQGFRACLGLIRLSDSFGAERAEAACRKALAISAPTYRSVKAILKNGMDRLPNKSEEPRLPPVEHDNIRGAQYYASGASDLKES